VSFKLLPYRTGMSADLLFGSEEIMVQMDNWSLMLCSIVFFVQIINTLHSDKSRMKEELDRINLQLQKQMADKEGCCQ